MKHINREYLRSTLFGIEDSLVSTTGLIAGLSVGNADKDFVILAGLVAIIVEAVSMGAGEYISTDALEEMDKMKRHSQKPAIFSGLLMLVSYILAGLIPLLPIVVFDSGSAFIVSVIFALFGLLVLGYVKGKLVNVSPIKSAIKILIIGGIATIVGIIAGRAFTV
jgi:VIT1/CCC1 family predicted Fe2+/Mn2+ transporter